MTDPTSVASLSGSTAAGAGGHGGPGGPDLGPTYEDDAVSPRVEAWKRFRRNRLALVGLGIIAVMFLMALLAPLITSFDPRIGGLESLASPSKKHWFGTDAIGRDIYTRVVYGARISLRVGILSALIATTIGIVAGVIAAYYGGWVDSLVMRFTDIFLALPYIILAIVLVIVVGRNETSIIYVLGFLGWMPIARIFRSSVLQIKEREFVEAARAMGCSDRRIIGRHLVPNAIQPVIAYAATFAGTAVLAEAALSFLNVGAVDPTPAWGLMVSQAKGDFDLHPQTLFFPGAAIFLMVVAFVFVGDGLRDALDPRLRK